MVKFLIIGDLHGQIPELHFKDFDAIIAPGDFCSDEMKPLVFRAYREILEDPERDVSWSDYVSKKKAQSMIKTSLKNGRKILEFLNKQNVPVILVPGNWDFAGKSKFDEGGEYHFPELMKGLKNLHNVHLKKYSCAGLNIIGHGISSGPEIPQHVKNVYSKVELRHARKKFDSRLKFLDKLAKNAKYPTILLTHNVPFNTPLDLITWKESPMYGKHYGSLLARKFIERHQPLVCIGAHMHEHFSKCKLGKTTCINAGFGGKVNVLLEIDQGKIKQLKFYPKEY